MVLPSSPVKVWGKFVQWILSYDRKKNRKTEITIDFIVTMWHYRIFYRIDYRFQLIGTFWYTVAFVVSWVRPWNETCEKMVFHFPFQISLKECRLCKTNSQSEAREFCIRWMIEKRNCGYRDQAIGIMGIQHKGLGL